MARNLIKNSDLRVFLSKRGIDEHELRTMVDTLVDTGGLNVFGKMNIYSTHIFIEQTEDDMFLVDGEAVYISPRNAVLKSISLLNNVTDWGS